MDIKNNDIPQIYDSTRDYEMYNEEMNDVFSSRYDNRFDNRYDRFGNFNNYDMRYDRDFNRRNRYYQYPYCDRYGRCDNSLWWLFWPFFFL